MDGGINEKGNESCDAESQRLFINDDYLQCYLKQAAQWQQIKTND